MARPAWHIAGMQALLDSLPTIDDVMFEASSAIRSKTVTIDTDGHTITLKKENYSKALGFPQISYTATLLSNGTAVDDIKLYVRYPVTVAKNRETMERIIQEVLRKGFGPTIRQAQGYASEPPESNN